jgi:hypothetical protein
MQSRQVISIHTSFSARTGKRYLEIALILLALGLIAYLTYRAANAQIVGPGVPQVGSAAPKSHASSSKAGSLLFFHKYTSDTRKPDKVNTQITLTNTNPTDGITVRLMAVHDCRIEDRFINLAANQSRTLLATKEFPDSTGHLVAVAVTPTGAPTQFNWLIGSATVLDLQGTEGSYNAFAVAKRTKGAVTGDGKTFDLNFDGKQFDPLPQSVAVDNLQSINADLTVYSPLPKLTDEIGSTNPILEATAYDAKGRPYTTDVNGYVCGLFSVASDIWTDQPLASFIKAGQPGWASFKAADRTDEKNPKPLPVLGVSFSHVSGKPASGAVAMQVLEWLEAFTISLSAKVPDIPAAPETPTTDLVDAVGGATGMSESKAGSLLFYPRFVSGKQGATLINMTNTHPAQKARVRLFFNSVAPDPKVSEKIVTIEPQQAISLKVSDVTDSQRGWIMALAINSGAQAIKFNHLIGSVEINEASGVTTTFNALAVGKNSDGAVARDEDDVKTATLKFNDEDFDRLPATWALAAVNNQNDFNSYLSYNRFSATQLEIPTTRGTGGAVVYDKTLTAYNGVIGQTEINLDELVKIRFNPQMPASATQANAGWLKLTLSSPAVAVISSFATGPVTHTQPDGWTGGLSGSSNLAILTTTDSYTIKIPSGNPNNERPIADFVPFLDLTEARSTSGTIVRLDGTLSSDPDPEDTLLYRWYDNGKLISTAAISDFRFSIGTHEIKLMVTDTSGEDSDPYLQTIQVKDTTAPTISRIPSDISISTSGGSAVVTFPTPVAFDALDGSVPVTVSRPSGSPFPLGSTIVTFTAADKIGNKATATMEVNVTAGADTAQTGGVAGSIAPFLANLNDQYVKPGEVRRILLQAQDADGDPVTFRLAGAHPRVTLGNIDPVARQATLFIGPLTPNMPSTLVRIQVNDNRRQSYTTLPFLVAVSDIPNDDTGSGGGGGTGGGQSNRPPTAAITPLPATIEATEVDGVVVELDGSRSTDPDLDSLTYSWSINGQAVAQGAMVQVKLGLGMHTIALAVADGRGGVGTATVRLQVLPRPLSVKAANPSRLTRGSSVILSITGTGFEPGARVFFSGSGIIVGEYFTRTESSLTISARIANEASLGTRDVTVINPDGKIASLRAGVTIR